MKRQLKSLSANALLITGIAGWISICMLMGCADKTDCSQQATAMQLYSQKTFVFDCNGNMPYQYVFTSIAQVNDLQPNCYLGGPVATPLHEDHVRYLIIGDTLRYKSDTVTGTVYKNDCAKTVTYDVRFIQRSDTLNDVPGIGSLFTIVEDVPEDYVVLFRKEYVLLP